MDTVILCIGIVSLVIVLALLVRQWQAVPRRQVARAHRIGELWLERERIRGFKDTHRLTHWESMQLDDRLMDINAELASLGVPRKSLE